MSDSLLRFAVAIDGRLLSALVGKDSAAATPADALEKLIVSALGATGAARTSSDLIRATGKVKVTLLP
jgi:hypothetical protein